MRHSLKTGLCFGLTSGVITTLGLMVGLASGTQSKLVVIGAILTIAVADSFSDALGIHMSEESENKHTAREIWESTFATLLSKFTFALTFVAPVLLFNLSTAVLVSIIWGLSMLSLMSYIIAKDESKQAWKVVGEHLLIAVIVIFLTHNLGIWIAATFK